MHDVDIDLGIFEVEKGEGGRHTVNFGIAPQEEMPSCTCKDWLRHHIPCKHFFAVFAHRPHWPWDRLPSAYQTSAYVSMDTAALEKQFQQTASALCDASHVDLPAEDIPPEQPSSDLPVRVRTEKSGL